MTWRISILVVWSCRKSVFSTMGRLNSAGRCATIQPFRPVCSSALTPALHVRGLVAAWQNLVWPGNSRPVCLLGGIGPDYLRTLFIRDTTWHDEAARLVPPALGSDVAEVKVLDYRRVDRSLRRLAAPIRSYWEDISPRPPSTSSSTVSRQFSRKLAEFHYFISGTCSRHSTPWSGVFQ